MSPTISVVTPCFNGAAYLRATLESALGQSRPPLEVIVVDDGSTDDSAVIAEAFGDPVRVVRQENQGESVARNRGIDEARGSHLLFLDADDLLEPAALETLVALLHGADERTLAVMATASFRSESGERIQVQRPEATELLPGLFSRNLAPVHAWLVPTAMVREAGGFAGEIQQLEDWDLWLRLAIVGAGLRTTDYVGALYRRHAQSQTSTTTRRNRALGHVALAERILDAVVNEPALLERHGFDLFWAGYEAVRTARSDGLEWRALHGLGRRLRMLCARGPRQVRVSRFGRTVRWAGYRTAHGLAEWSHRDRREEGSACPQPR